MASQIHKMALAEIHFGKDESLYAATLEDIKNAIGAKSHQAVSYTLYVAAYKFKRRWKMMYPDLPNPFEKQIEKTSVRRLRSKGADSRE
jgi:hypothetical protein